MLKKAFHKQTFYIALLTTFLFFSGMVVSVAQDYSYVYIQGDKSIPFYVKLEGEMLPRYGKNYAIISRLVPGVINLQILFQQNAYPPHSFSIKVPDNGSRSFLLTKRGESFSLFDLQQGFYLQPGNTLEDDQVPVQAAAYSPIAYQEPKPASTVTRDAAKVPKPAVKKTTSSNKTPTTVKAKTPPPAKPTTPIAPPAPAGTPQFLEDIELYNEHTAPPSATLVADSEGNLIPNSDCPQALSDAQVEAIHRKTMSYATEESRLGYLNSQLHNCYSTEQAARLVQTLESNAARYSWLKKVYPRISNQSAFGGLSELFSDDAWKTHFLELIQ